MENWYVALNDPHAFTTVELFVKKLEKVRLEGDCQMHAVFIDSPQAQGNFHESLLEWWSDPQTLAVLASDIRKDLDPARDCHKIDFIVTLRSTFVAYLRNVVNFQNLNRKQAVNFFLMMHRYQILLTMPQYGLLNILKSVVRKMLDLLYNYGVLPLFLIFCDWYPDYVTEKYHPLVKNPGTELVNSQLQLIQDNPILFNLLQKHQDKWSRYLLPQIQP
jgi:hypothetical protein